jgi:hypothetical protein
VEDFLDRRVLYSVIEEAFTTQVEVNENWPARIEVLTLAWFEIGEGKLLVVYKGHVVSHRLWVFLRELDDPSFALDPFFLKRGLEEVGVVGEISAVYEHLILFWTDNESNSVVAAEVIGDGHLILLRRRIFVGRRVSGCV